MAFLFMNQNSNIPTFTILQLIRYTVLCKQLVADQYQNQIPLLKYPNLYANLYACIEHVVDQDQKCTCGIC